MKEEILNKIEKSFERTQKVADFGEKYKELITSFIKLRREAAIVGIEVNQVSLPQFWFTEYPELDKDMHEVGLRNRLLGFDIL